MFESPDYEKVAEEQDSKEGDPVILPDVVDDNETSSDMRELMQSTEIAVKEKMKGEMLAESISRMPSSFARIRGKKIKVIINEQKK